MPQLRSAPCSLIDPLVRTKPYPMQVHTMLISTKDSSALAMGQGDAWLGAGWVPPPQLTPGCGLVRPIGLYRGALLLHVDRQKGKLLDLSMPMQRICMLLAAGEPERGTISDRSKQQAASSGPPHHPPTHLPTDQHPDQPTNKTYQQNLPINLLPALEWTPDLDPSAHDAVALLFDRFGASSAASQLGSISAGLAVDLQLALDTGLLVELCGACDGSGIDEVEASGTGGDMPLERLGLYMAASEQRAGVCEAFEGKASLRPDLSCLALVSES
jgi:hypothetical protein